MAAVSGDEPAAVTVTPTIAPGPLQPQGSGCGVVLRKARKPPQAAVAEAPVLRASPHMATAPPVLPSPSTRQPIILSSLMMRVVPSSADLASRKLSLRT
jgi:hypothetical protein